MKLNKLPSNKISEEELKIDEEFQNNIFYEEFQRVSEGKNIINLKKLLKMDVSNETGDFKINICHIPTLYFLDSNKDGLFTKKDLLNLSKIAEEKEKKYKRYEFTSQLQAHFTLLMSKKVCSEQGEAEFVSWLIKLVTGGLPPSPPKEGIDKNNFGENNTNSNILSESEDDEYNPDPNKYVDRSILRTLYDVLNVSTSHKIDFQSFFELMKINSDELEENSEGNEEFVLISVLEFFCKNFIRGFNKLIFDLGLDSIVENE